MQTWAQFFVIATRNDLVPPVPQPPPPPRGSDAYAISVRSKVQDRITY